MADLVTEDFLRETIQRLATIIGLTGTDVIGFAPGIDMGFPYIHLGPGEELHWIVKERGQTLQDRVTRDVDELLYWSFQSATFSMAANWEARHRVGDQNFRIALWRKQQELLTALKPAWAKRRRDELIHSVPDAAELLSTVPD